MVQILRRHSNAPEIKHALRQIVEPDLGVQGLKCDREILVGHLSCEARLELPAAAARGVDLPEVARDEQRREEWESLNVIPMGVRDEEMAMGRAVARRWPGSERTEMQHPKRR